MPSIRQHHHNHIIESTRPQGGFFIPGISPEKTCAELTTVNKQRVIRSLSINCKDAILPPVKPGMQNETTWLTTERSEHYETNKRHQ